MRLEGGEKVDRPLAGTKESFPQKKNNVFKYFIWEGGRNVERD